MLDRNLMIHSFRNLTLENLEDKDERMECNESKYFPQYVHSSNKGDMIYLEIGWKVGYLFDKPADMEVDGEGPDYMDEDLRVLMLKEEGTH